MGMVSRKWEGVQHLVAGMHFKDICPHSLGHLRLAKQGVFPEVKVGTVVCHWQGLDHSAALRRYKRTKSTKDDVQWCQHP